MNTLPHSLFTEFDIHLFREGKHFKLFEKFGAHPLKLDSQKGTYFAVWAPNAEAVSVIGDFNYWNPNSNPLYPRWDHSGIWEGFVPHAKSGQCYKYHFNRDGHHWEKGDPYARLWEMPPRTASVIWEDNYQWHDGPWMKSRAKNPPHHSPVSVYELHLGSWRRNPLENSRSLTYRELAEELVPYVVSLGFTHVELMPVMEHPYDPSWGYQQTGYFAPTSRFGTPDDFKFLIDKLHENGIGVYLDWVPSHFPGDAHGLYRFDGTALYEHEDPRLGYHPDWSSYIFNYGRNEVKSFLISNAAYWIEQFHADGLRVDAVASMLYLDYSRKHDEWIPNRFGGRENLEAIEFMRELNTHLYQSYEGITCIAEESTSWPGVTHPVHHSGLGFGMKWMMGWMNDNLRYFSKAPIYRSFHQNDLTFSLNYAFTENFMLPLSHDEVVHGKGSLLQKMPGDRWQKLANLRLLYGWMFTHPGTKLLFMGAEMAQTDEWNHAYSLPWHLLNDPAHKGIFDFVKDLNALYKSHPALYAKQFEREGFEWLDYADTLNSILWFLRKGKNKKDILLVGVNASPQVFDNYRIGIPEKGEFVEVLNSDDHKYGGSGFTNSQPALVEKLPSHGQPFSIEVRMPPLAVSVWKWQSNKISAKQ
jgi:1,4-alpha-glucan branching enzyme